jgi:hypothetical protein
VHMTFYAGLPRTMSAITDAEQVLGAHPQQRSPKHQPAGDPGRQITREVARSGLTLGLAASKSKPRATSPSGRTGP